MRRPMLALGLLALTVSVGAQAPAPNKMGLTRASSAKSERNGNITHLTGNVIVWVGNARVTADEAFVNFETEEIEFRGNVRMAPARGR